MPVPGETCDGSTLIDLTDDGEVLVCRNNMWQRVGDAPPVRGGTFTAREVERIVQRQRQEIDWLAAADQDGDAADEDRDAAAGAAGD